MSDQYKGGTIPKNLDPQLRQLLEDHDRALVRGIPRSNISPQVLPTPSGGSNKPRGPISQTSYQISGVEGNVGTIPPQPFGSIVVWRFTGSPTLLADSGNLFLNSDFIPDGPNATLTLVCDGVSWFELSRVFDDGYSLACPVIINEAGEPCDPVVRIESDILSDFVYLDGTTVSGRGSLWVGTEGAPSDNTYAMVVGGPSQEASTRPGLLVQGRHTRAFTVSGAFGGGGDDALEVDTTQGNIVLRVNGDVSIKEQLRLASADSTISADQNPWTVPDTSVIRLASDVDGRLIRSIVADTTDAAGGTVIYDVINVGDFFVTFVDEDAGATAINRIVASANGADFDLMPSDTCRLWYDSGTGRWRVLK